jgi:hypothetical protein
MPTSGPPWTASDPGARGRVVPRVGAGNDRGGPGSPPHLAGPRGRPVGRVRGPLRARWPRPRLIPARAGPRRHGRDFADGGLTLVGIPDRTGRRPPVAVQEGPGRPGRPGRELDLAKRFAIDGSPSIREPAIARDGGDMPGGERRPARGRTLEIRCGSRTPAVNRGPRTRARPGDAVGPRTPRSMGPRCDRLDVPERCRWIHERAIVSSQETRCRAGIDPVPGSATRPSTPDGQA